MRKQMQQTITPYTFMVVRWTLISVSTSRSLPSARSRILNR